MNQDAAAAGSGEERILHAAIELFGQRGVAATSLKAIAAHAGVSQALIIHHYGSKDALRTACDVHVAELLRETKTEQVAQGAGLNPVLALAAIEEYQPAMRYLARTLTDGSPHANSLIDDMVADAQVYTADAVDQGLVRPSTDPAARVAVLTLMGMGTLVLHEHLRRLIGEDLIGSDGPPLRYINAVMELFTDGFFTEGAYTELRQYASQNAPAPPPAAPNEDRP